MILLIVLGILIMFAIICLFAWYRIVDPSEAHLVATPSGKFVVSPDDKVGETRTYFAIPSYIPFFGRAIRIMDVTIKEIPMEQETIEKNQARYNVKSSTKYRIEDVKVAAETFISNEELNEQLKEIIRAGVRAITVQYTVVEARAKKREMEDKIREEILTDLEKWGLELINFQLVDFKDTADSKIISNISKRSEVEIEAQTREQNAEKNKQAKIKEAEADEKAKEREISRDKVIGERKQEMAQAISEKEKIAKEKEFAVKQVEVVKQAEITKQEAEIKAKQEKEVAIIKANQDKEAEKIIKEQRHLEGEGYRLREEEKAKGNAAPIKEQGIAEAEIIKAKGFAEAEAKEKLQKALNQFGDKAIRALVAEKVVEKDRAIGIETAKALINADLKVFAGGDSDKQGFDLGKIIQATRVADETSSDSILNRMARPNDLGLSALGLSSLKEKSLNDNSSKENFERETYKTNKVVRNEPKKKTNQ